MNICFICEAGRKFDLIVINCYTSTEYKDEEEKRRMDFMKRLKVYMTHYRDTTSK